MPDIRQLRFSSMGESALLCDAGGSTLELQVQERIWCLAEIIGQWPNVRETVPGMNNLLIVYDSMGLSPTTLKHSVIAAWSELEVVPRQGRIIDVAVHYGGDQGADLSFVAQHSGLASDEVVALHCARDYVVYCLGSQPGFGYLAGMDERLATPRREVPRTRVEAGSVVIGGAQTGVISCTSPSGWHIIGRTEVAFFEPARSSPILLAPGDRVRFHAESITP